MTLKEFVAAYMEATGNKGNVDQMIKKINDEAKKRAKDGCAVLSEEDVEKIIDGIKLDDHKSEPQTAKKVETNKQTPKAEKPARKAETKPQKESEQMSLFDFGV